MPRANSSTPAPDSDVADVPADETPAELDVTTDPVADDDDTPPAPEFTPVDHWWVAAADFAVTIDWCTVTAKAGQTRFDPVTGAKLVALGCALSPLED